MRPSGCFLMATIFAATAILSAAERIAVAAIESAMKIKNCLTWRILNQLTRRSPGRSLERLQRFFGRTVDFKQLINVVVGQHLPGDWRERGEFDLGSAVARRDERGNQSPQAAAADVCHPRHV